MPLNTFNRRVLLGGLSSAATYARAEAQSGLVPCMHLATTMRAGFERSMQAYAKAGFRAVELWLATVDEALAKSPAAALKRILDDHGLKPVSAGSIKSLFFTRSPEHPKRMEELKGRLELCAQLGIPFLVSPSVVSERRIEAADFERAVDAAHTVGDLARPFNVTVGVEFLKTATFLSCLGSALELCRKAAHPNVRPMLDTFHFYAGVSKMEDLDLLKNGELGLVHISDLRRGMPREMLADRDRVLPGEGTAPLRQILAKVREKGYQGAVSLELFNEQLWALEPEDASRRGFESLRQVIG